MRVDVPVQIHAMPHPLRPALLHATAPVGLTLAQMLGDAGSTIHAWVGDAYVPRAHWRHVRPKAGAVVTVKAVAQGGDGNKALRTVLQIAVLVASLYVGGLGGFGYQLAGAAIAVGGNLAINKLVPPQLPKSVSPGKNLAALTGTQNEFKPYEPIPRVYGRTRVYPPFAARPYTEVVGRQQYLRALYCLGYGPLALTDLKLGETPLTPAGLALVQGAVTAGITLDHVEYEIGSEPTLFSTAVSEETLNTALNGENASDMRVTAPNTREISLDFTFPAGLFAVDDEGSLHTIAIKLDINYAPVDGSWYPPSVKDSPGLQFSGADMLVDPEFEFDFWIKTKAKNAFRTSIRWTVPPGQYQVSVARRYFFGASYKQFVTEDMEGAVHTCYWTALRSVQNSPPTLLANAQYLALRIKATDQLTGLTDSINLVAQSVLDVWDGTQFVQQATANPAWVYLDIAGGSATERALAKASRFNLAELKAWADDCTAAGREFNAEVVATFGRTTVFELMRDVAAVGRASFTMRDGLYTVVRDVAGATPVQVFTPRNSWGFAAQKTFADLPHALRVRFVNAAKGWQPGEVVVYDDGYTNSNATRFEALELRGVTSQTQAWKEGRYHLAVARLRDTTYTLNADVESLVCSRGDLVHVAHDVLRVGLAWGRITSVAGTSVRLDEPVTMEAGKIYALRVRKADGSQALQVIVTAAGITDVVSLGAAVAGLAAGDLFVFGESGQETLACKVLRIEPQAELTARLTLVPDAAGIYTADQSGAPPDPAGETVDRRAPAAPKAYLVRSDEDVLLAASDGGLVSRILVNFGWTSNDRAPPITVESQYRPTGEDPWLAGPVVAADAGELSLLPVEDGRDYELRLRALAADGTPSDWTTPIAHTVVGKTTPPPDVATLFLNGPAISWDYPNPPRDFQGFLVRYQAGLNTNWDNAVAAHAGVLGGPPFDVSSLPTGTLTIMVKAVDTAGFESVNAATLFKDFGDPIVANLLFTRDDDQLGYPGTITNGTVVGTDLQANVAGTFWPAAADTAAFWDGASTALFWTQIYETLTYEVAFAPDVLTVGDDSTLTVHAVVTQAPSWRLEYRVDGSSYAWSGDGTASYWGADAATFWPEGDGDYRPWPGALTGVQRVTYHLRLTLDGGLVQGIVDRFSITVDVPDIVERLDDVALAAGGTVLPITQTYRAIANVSLTLQDDGGSARSVKILNKSTSGPLVQAFDSAGAGTTAVVDAIIQGY